MRLRCLLKGLGCLALTQGACRAKKNQIKSNNKSLLCKRSFWVHKFHDQRGCRVIEGVYTCDVTMSQNFEVKHRFSFNFKVMFDKVWFFWYIFQHNLKEIQGDITSLYSWSVVRFLWILRLYLKDFDFFRFLLYITSKRFNVTSPLHIPDPLWDFNEFWCYDWKTLILSQFFFNITSKDCKVTPPQHIPHSEALFVVFYSYNNHNACSLFISAVIHMKRKM